MVAVIRTILSETRGNMRLLALSALVGLLAAAALSLAPAAADGHDNPELVLSIVEDSDNIVAPGGAFSVRAQIRYSGSAGLKSEWIEVLDGSNLRLAGALDWDDRSIGAALGIPARFAIGGPRYVLEPTVGGSAHETVAYPVAWDGRTLVARAASGAHAATSTALIIFDTSADPPEQAAEIAATSGEGLGSSGVSDRPMQANSVAVWQEDDDTAWIFAGAPKTGSNQGKLYIYKVSYSAPGAATVVEATSLTPPASEYTNTSTDTTSPARYGGAVAISADGQTLAVGAEGMARIGAVYVYTRPSGADQDWSDILYPNGVRVSSVPLPAWGNTGNYPFNPVQTSVGPAYNQCDAYCSRAQANLHSAFGAFVELSADGSTLLVAAPLKRHADNTPPGQAFLTPPPQAGAVWVFSAPEGGWSAAPDATAGKTLIAAQANARAWDVTTHYSPGPDRRVETADAELLPVAWSVQRAANDGFGEPAHLSADGGTVAVIRRTGANPSIAYIFEKPADGWASSSTATATITLGVSGNTAEGRLGADLNADGSRLLVMDELLDRAGEGATDNVGGTLVFERSGDSWSSEGAAGDGVVVRADAARIIYMPNPQAGAKGGRPVYDNTGEFAAFGETDYDNAASVTPRVYASVADTCTERTLDDETTTTCPLALGDTTITVPIGTPDGPFTISGNVGLVFGDGTEAANVRGELEARIGTVDELAKLEFAFATDTLGDSDSSNDRPYPSVVAPGGSTTLQLKLLNENGKASAKGAAASVLFSTTRGGLSARLASASGEACAASGGQSCRIANPATALTADNADQIRLTVTHPGVAQAGAARVRAVVVNAAGRTFRTEPITVIFAGPPTTLAIAEPPALLGYVPADSVDQRNIATLVVSATDAAGNKATVPDGRRSWKLTSPDRKAIDRRQIEVTWPLRKGGTGDDAGELVRSEGDPQARVTILADAATPLTEGEYTLELSVGSGAAKLTDTQTFVVTGGAAALTLSADPAGEVAERDTVTLTAAVTDANGEPAPDGTPVTFSEGSASGEVVLVLLNPARQLTRGGQASVELRAVNGGVGYVRAEADAASGVQTISVAAGAGSVEGAIVSLTLDGFSIWSSAQPTTAAELHARLANVARISKWHGSGWYSYGRAGGQFVADSVNFPINPGDTLWLDSK